MRTLSSTLTTAQQAASHRPYLKCVVSADVAAFPRLLWTRLYTGAEPDAHHALAFPSNGSLVRVRAGATNAERMTVTTPGAASDFSVWTSAGITTGPVAIAAHTARVLLVVNRDAGDIYESVSTDSGATWGAGALVQALARTGAALAFAFKSATSGVLFYESAAGEISSKAWTSAGGWAASAAWSNSAATITGIAVHYLGDYNLLVTGTDASGNSACWTVIYGDGYSYAAGTWGALDVLLISGSASNVTYSWPSITYGDTFRGSVIERYSGTGGVRRPYLTALIRGSDPVENRWREPWPFNTTVSGSQGVPFAFDTSGSAYWLATPWGIWRAPLSAGANVDLSAAVLKADVRESFGSGRVMLDVNNASGTYDSPGSGDLAALQLGARLDVSPGYTTSAGDESSAGGPAWFITALEHVFGEGRALLRIVAEDGWHWSSTWRARRSHVWASGAKTAFQLIQLIASRSGFDVVGDGTLSAVSSSLKPAFHLSPGSNGKAALMRLLSLIPDVARWDTTTLRIRQVAAADASTYSYGASGQHHVLSATRTRSLPAVNHARVVGASILGESIAFTELDLVLDQAEVVADPYGVAADVSAVAAGLVREAIARAAGGQIVVPVNCGQELWDVITVTHAHAGWSTATTARVIGLHLRYDRSSPSRPTVYEHTLTLGGV